MPWPKRPLPKMARVSQQLRGEHIEDPRADVRQRLMDEGLRNKIRQGDRVAITAGSRGIGGFVELLSGIADAVKAAGGKPFVVPAMGSHGSATAEGQTELLRRLGASEQTLGAPVHSTMETFALGTSETGAVAHIDKAAAEADGIIVLGRVKTHPEGGEGLASGLLKMTAIGLGKQAGAQEAHNHGLWPSVKAVPKLSLVKSRILFGVAVVENAYRQPVHIEVVPASYDAFKMTDERLLELAKPHVAKIPFAELDLLIVDEIGKTISGTGMDLNVIGPWRVSGGKREPNFSRIVALSLTFGSLGNGLGIGLADFTTERFKREFDPVATYINLLTAAEPDSMNSREGPLPLALASDREAIEVALYSALPPERPRVCRIQSTAHLSEFWVSEGMLDEVNKNPRLTLLAPPEPVQFDAQSNLF
jgi:hypothetical protein